MNTTTETEVYRAFGEAYTLTRHQVGTVGANWYVEHQASGVRANGAFGTRGYAVGWCRSDAQRRQAPRRCAAASCEWPAEPLRLYCAPHDNDLVTV